MRLNSFLYKLFFVEKNYRHKFKQLFSVLRASPSKITFFEKTVGSLGATFHNWTFLKMSKNDF
jgi:hypothetical protein